MSFNFGRFARHGVSAFVLICAAATWATAEDVRIAAWNLHEGFTTESVAARKAELAEFGGRIRPDVLVLEEVVGAHVVEAAAAAMGLSGYHTACSDFTHPDEPDFGHFEVAVVSKYPITQVIEYDPTPDRDPTSAGPEELPILPLRKLGLAAPVEPAGLRGFLWVRIDALKLTVIGVHLKSSRGSDGEADKDNAARREFVAAAVAECVAQDRRLFPDYTCIVAGDFNVGHSDRKNGVDLRHDAYDLSGLNDGYDETHALLRDGLVGVRMRNLTAGQTESTFPGIPSTPIDNIYVLGPDDDRFEPARLSTETFGSDHRAVFTTWHRPPGSAGATTPPIVPTPASTGRPAPRPSASPSSGNPLNAAPPTAVAAAEAAQHVGKRCVVTFEVRAGAVINDGKLGFLNSEVDFRSPQNFTALLNEQALAAFAAAGIADPVKHFRGKRVSVTGFVELRRGQTQVIVSDPKQVVEATAP